MNRFISLSMKPNQTKTTNQTKPNQTRTLWVNDSLDDSTVLPHQHHTEACGVHCVSYFLAAATKYLRKAASSRGFRFGSQFEGAAPSEKARWWEHLAPGHSASAARIL